MDNLQEKIRQQSVANLNCRDSLKDFEKDAAFICSLLTIMEASIKFAQIFLKQLHVGEKLTFNIQPFD